MERQGRDSIRKQTRRLEELEGRTRDLDGALDYEDRAAYEARHREERDARLAQGHGEAELDEAVDESFPASDPASPARNHEDGSVNDVRRRSFELDDALDDTFPASDTPAILTPRRDKS